MYAVFKTGGKQYRATQGEKIKLEKLESKSGKKVVFEEVLLVGEGSEINVGTPYLADVTVEAKILSEGKDKKIEVIKFKRRKNYKRHFGHRQCYTLVEITAIKLQKKQTTKAKKTTTKKTAAKKTTTKKAAAKKTTTKKAAAKKTVAKSTKAKTKG